ncbi:MAG: hypothetical protein BMS9Abin37_2710 [Acidobacteriota bacterium]|nr:MAG: hypothetical protein BMS9Abin37_2710 [Acidobacteriota bacterium]
MSGLSRIKSTFRSLLRKEELERDLDEELQSYLNLLTEEKIQEGLRPDEAHRQARLELGGLEQVKDRTREERAGASIDTLFQDIRYALRTLGKNIGFSAIAVSILAIGIGANTALFSTINTVLLRQIPFENPDQLVMGQKTREGRLAGPVSKIDLLDYRRLNRSFEDVAAHGFISRQTVTGDGRPIAVRVGYDTWNLFQTLGVNPIAGRPFLPEEQELGGADVVLLSFGFWQSRFGGAPEAIGDSLNLDGSPCLVVGVMPRGFRFLEEADLWRPIERDGLIDAQRDSHSLTLVGRLKSGVSMDEAQSEMDVISRSLEQQYPDTNKGKGLLLTDLHAAMVQDVRLSLLVLLATTALVLLIACETWRAFSLPAVKNACRRWRCAWPSGLRGGAWSASF